MITHQYEEYKPIRLAWSWLAIVLLAIVTGIWGMATHMAVPDVVRQWDFDILPDTPGISPYSTLPPPGVWVPKRDLPRLGSLSPVPPQIDLPEERLRIKQPPAPEIPRSESQIPKSPPSREG